MAQNQSNQHSGQNQRQATQNQSNKSNRGFASMDEDKQREIASKGGRASRGSNQQASQK